MDDVVNQHKDQQEKHELLLWAAARGLLPDVQELVSQGADSTCKDKSGRTPCHYAAAHGHVAVLEYLATRGVDLDSEDAQGRGPLHYAALGDHAAAVEFLCGRGVWVDAPDGADDTPLHLAARGLKPGVDAAAATPATAPAAAATATVKRVGAAVRQSAEAVRALLRSGAKVEVRNARGLTPLSEAVAVNNAGGVAVLLEGKALATVTIKGYSLLHVAAGLGHSECLERLLVEGRRPPTDNTDNPEGLAPLHAALQQGQVACAKLLLERGADTTTADGQGRLPCDLLPSAPTATQGTNTTPADSAALQWVAQRLQRAAGGKTKAPTQATAGATGGGARGGVAGVELSPRDQFRLLDRKEQVRKVMLYAGMADSELRVAPFPPPDALTALQAVRKAYGLHTCWEAVAAIRQDASFQEDASDPRMKEAIEDLKRPNVDASKYMRDRQIQGVFSKMNKLHGIMRQYGQGFKVTLDDLLAKPRGPSSIPETLRQLQVLEAKLRAAQAAAIAAVAGEEAPEPEEDATSTNTSSTGTGGGPGKQKGPAGKASKANEEVDPYSLVGGPLGTVTEGSEESPAWHEGWWEVLVLLARHVGRALFMACIMLAAMWILGMMPDQVRDRQKANVLEMQQRLLEQQLSSVDGGVSRSPGAAAVSVLEGLLEANESTAGDVGAVGNAEL